MFRAFVACTPHSHTSLATCSLLDRCEYPKRSDRLKEQSFSMGDLRSLTPNNRMPRGQSTTVKLRHWRENPTRSEPGRVCRSVSDAWIGRTMPLMCPRNRSKRSKPSSKALVSNSKHCLLLVRHLFLVAWHLLLLATWLPTSTPPAIEPSCRTSRELDRWPQRWQRRPVQGCGRQLGRRARR